MASDPLTIQVPASASGQSFTIHFEPKAQDWRDPALYAPAIPGVIVALLGVWLVHRLTLQRDRRKEIVELCNATKDAAATAEAACIAGWLSTVGDERTAAILEAKGKLQALGIAATHLQHRTCQGAIRAIRSVFSGMDMSINVINEVAALRSVATDDPFEDAQRPPDASKGFSISTAAGALTDKINTNFHALYG